MQVAYTIIKIIYFSLKRFLAEKRLLWAASLTYTTVFSLIPLLSVLFFIFNIFGSLADIKNIVQPYIYKTLAPGAQEKVISILNELVNNINFGTIGIFSTSVLVISVFLLLFEIEYALNEIWLIKKKPSVLSRAAVYWAFLTIGPVLIALSLFIFVSLQTYIPVKIIENYISAHVASLLSYALIWVAFTLIYFFMPGTPVNLPSALFGGIIAGTLWKVSGIGFSLYTTRFLVYYPKIFGSLAAIPLFLFWILVCWLFFLFGAELTYMHQNRLFYASTYKTPELRGNDRQYLEILIFLYIAQQFIKNAQPVSLKKISFEMKIPFHIVFDLLEPIVQHGLLVESVAPKSCFIPGKPLDKIVLNDVYSLVQQQSHKIASTYQLSDAKLMEAGRQILLETNPENCNDTIRNFLSRITA